MSSKRSREHDVTFSTGTTGMPVVFYRQKKYFWPIESDMFEMFKDHAAFSHLIYWTEDGRPVIRVTDMQRDMIACVDQELIENGFVSSTIYPD